MLLLMTFFEVCYAICANLQMLTCCRNNQNDHGLPHPTYITDTDFPADGDLDLIDLDENSTFTFLHLDLFDFCYAEAEKELDGQVESIGEDEADALYGVSNNMNNVSDLTVSQKESVDGMIEPNDNDNKEPPVHNDTESQVLQLFDDDDKASGSPSDIFDIIRL